MQQHRNFSIRFPDVDAIEQGEEFFILEHNGQTEKVRFHDYDRIYQIPGLYEHLFYERYRCNSPEVVCSLLESQVKETDEDSSALHVLDIGAGNGMVGEELANRGAASIIGIDIIEEAAEAAERDRPGLYDAYHVADLTCLPPDLNRSLEARDLNCMTVVAALGFDDIPPVAFARGYNLVSSPAWVAFNIKEDFVCEDDKTGFCRMIELLESDGVLDIQDRRRYRHRFCQDGTPLYYQAVVGRKQEDIPESIVEAFM
ncbi:MAG: methyltransferase domain-containing protein [Desulfobacterales bacterium]